MTTIKSVFQTKLECLSNDDLQSKTDQNKLANFTCFNDAIQSFLVLKLCPTPHLRIEGR